MTANTHFGDLTKPFHMLQPLEQLLVVRNTASIITGGEADLRLKDMKTSELQAVYTLANHPDLRGPFASTVFDYPAAWKKYLSEQGTSSGIVNYFRMAEKSGLWTKYIGMHKYDRQLMSQIMHSWAINASVNGKLIWKEYEPMSPGLAWPAYDDAVRSFQSTVQSVLVLGVLGPYSLLEIVKMVESWNAAATVQFIDLYDGMLSRVAAAYNVNFEVANATKLPYQADSFDLVLSNSLFLWPLSNFDGNEERVIAAYKTRADIITEVHRVLTHGGHAVMVERPFTVYVNGENSDNDDLNTVLDHARVVSDMDKVGLIDISQSPSKRVATRRDLWRRIVAGRMWQKTQIARIESAEAMVFVAKK